MAGDVLVIDSECISALGRDRATTWERASSGESGIGPITRYDPGSQSLHGLADVVYAGQVPYGYDELAGSAAKYAKWPEPAHHAVGIVVERMLERLDLKSLPHDPQRVGVLGGTALTAQISQDVLTTAGAADPKFILHQCHNIALALVASKHGIQGPSFALGSACASSSHAMMIAAHLIRAGTLDAAIVVGFDFPVLPLCVGGFTWMNALYRRDDEDDRAFDQPAVASRPCSNDRKGFVVAEGVGAACLASPGFANKAGWSPKAYLRGGYMNSDADHLTRLSVDNTATCMSGALKDAQVSAEQIECVNAHATSTPMGDRSELQALAKVFGPALAQKPVVANKSQIGHALGAAAILAAILTMEGMSRGVLLPTLNHVPDPTLPAARFLSETTDFDHRMTLVNAFGFGGTNVSLVLERA